MLLLLFFSFRRVYVLHSFSVHFIVMRLKISLYHVLLSEYWRLGSFSILSLPWLHHNKSFIFLYYSTRVALNIEEGLIITRSSAIDSWASHFGASAWSRGIVAWVLWILTRMSQGYTAFIYCLGWLHLRVWKVYYLIWFLNLNRLTLSFIRRYWLLWVSNLSIVSSIFILFFLLSISILVYAQSIPKIILFESLEIFLVFFLFFLRLLIIVKKVLILLRLRKNILVLVILIASFIDLNGILMSVCILFSHAVKFLILTLIPGNFFFVTVTVLSVWLRYSSRTHLDFFIGSWFVEISLLHQSLWYNLLILVWLIQTWEPWIELKLIHAVWSFVNLLAWNIKSTLSAPLRFRYVNHRMIFSLLIVTLKRIEHLAWTHRSTKLLHSL